MAQHGHCPIYGVSPRGPRSPYIGAARTHSRELCSPSTCAPDVCVPTEPPSSGTCGFASTTACESARNQHRNWSVLVRAVDAGSINSQQPGQRPVGVTFRSQSPITARGPRTPSRPHRRVRHRRGRRASYSPVGEARCAAQQRSGAFQADPRYRATRPPRLPPSKYSAWIRGVPSCHEPHQAAPVSI